jgi:hypothetical protein
MARATVSKAVRRGFESLYPCSRVVDEIGGVFPKSAPRFPS